MDLTPGEQRLLAFWGPLHEAASQRLTTAETWSLLHNYAVDKFGKPLTGVSITDLNTVRGMVVERRNAAANFAAASPGDVIDARMIATAPWSAPLNERNRRPAWEVAYEHIVDVPSDAGPRREVQWRTATFLGRLPGTREMLDEQLTSDAFSNAEKYSQSHVSIGQVIITAV